MRRRFLILITLTQIIFAIMAVSVVAYAINLKSTQEQVTPVNQTINSNSGLIAIGAGLAIGLAAIGSGYAIATSGAAAISALAEKPDTFFRSFLVVALAEAISIYGLIIGILLWLKI